MKFSDPSPDTCLKCHEKGLEKLLSKTSFQLKGEGWYVTDFRDKAKTKPSTDKADSDQPSSDSKAPDTPTKEASSSTAAKEKPAAAPKPAASKSEA